MGFVCRRQMFSLQSLSEIIKVPCLANLHWSKPKKKSSCAAGATASHSFVPGMARHEKGESKNKNRCQGLSVV